MKKRFVYLDNASVTKVDDRVLRAMNIYHTKYYSVPTVEYGHSFGLKSRKALEQAREAIAESINANKDEIIFTSGQTESNNLAIKGFVAMNNTARVITTKIEHESILNVCKDYGNVAYLDVDREGFIKFNSLKRLQEEGAILSIQHANHEIGTVQNIKRIGRFCRKAGITFHVDATQTFMKLDIDVERMNIDLLTISPHLIHGPRGIGALYIRKGVKIKAILSGGYNEFGIRPGLENIPAIVGFRKAVEIFDKKDVSRMFKLRDRLMKNLLEIDNTKLNGPLGKDRLCNNVNISFRYVEGESMLLHLDLRGIIVTTGSSCFSTALKPSHVILGIGGRHEDAHSSVRFSLSKYNDVEDIDYTIKNVNEVVSELRKISM